MIYAISYDYPHLKTEQVLVGLHNHGIRDLTLYCLPFSKRPSRMVIFHHRPNQFEACAPDQICKGLGFNYERFEYPTQIPRSDKDTLLLGAGILPAEFVKNRTIINCHPGLLPTAKGLDALKWAIFYGVPLGCSLHVIDENVDEGKLLASRRTPVFETDDFVTISRRHYENEIDLLINYREHIERGETVAVSSKRFRHKRMSIETEAKLVRKLDSYKEQSPSNRYP